MTSIFGDRIKTAEQPLGASSVTDTIRDVPLRLRTELLAMYEFNDGAARVTDTSGYDRHGTLVGGARHADDPVRGPSLSLDGTSAYVELPNGILDTAGEVTVDTGTIVQGAPIGTNTTGQEAEGPHCVGAAEH